jgi:hypothetical protein
VTFDGRRHVVIRRGPIIVACNLAEIPTTIAVECSDRMLLASDSEIRRDGRAIHLPAESIAILEALDGDDVSAARIHQRSSRSATASVLQTGRRTVTLPSVRQRDRRRVPTAVASASA